MAAYNAWSCANNSVIVPNGRLQLQMATKQKKFFEEYFSSSFLCTVRQYLHLVRFYPSFLARSARTLPERRPLPAPYLSVPQNNTPKRSGEFPYHFRSHNFTKLYPNRPIPIFVETKQKNDGNVTLRLVCAHMSV